MDLKEYNDMMLKYATCGVIATGISMARDVGILDILLKAEEPLTIQQISERGSLKERYVKELIGALATGGVVQVDQSSSLFHVQPEFKPALRLSALYTRFTPYLGEKYKAIMNCFAKDGPAGVRYAEYPGIFDILDELRIETQDSLIDEIILPSHQPLAEKLKSGIDVLEIGSASGTVILNLSKRFPNTRFTGSDVVDSVIDIATVKSQEQGITNCKFINLDVCNIPENPAKQYDWIYVRDVVHDLPKPQEALSGINRMLKPGGIFTMMDNILDGSVAENVGNSNVSFYFTLGTFLCIPESFQGGDSMALGPCWDARLARGMIAKAGFVILNEVRNPERKCEVTFVCQKQE